MFIEIQRFNIWIAFLLVGFLLGVQLLQRKGPLAEVLNRQPIWVRWFIYYIGIAFIIGFPQYGPKQFIYFQF